MEERKALLEETQFLSPDAYKWGQQGEGLPYRDGINIEETPCSRWQWHVDCYSKMQKACYTAQVWYSSDLRNWYYVCHKGPAHRVEVVRCLACDDVYMCREHRIFPDCIQSGNAIPICCRHSRYTPGLDCWNPVGGYPRLREVSYVKKEETWQQERDDDWTTGLHFQ
eukprot:4077488-Amphidinium_carterae.1